MLHTAHERFPIRQGAFPKEWHPPPPDTAQVCKLLSRDSGIVKLPIRHAYIREPSQNTMWVRTKLLESPLITLVVVSYIIPYTTPLLGV